MPQVQLRLPKGSIKEIDKLVVGGRFKSRSDAIRAMIELYEERENTRKFLKMLLKRRGDVQKNPKILIPLDEIK